MERKTSIDDALFEVTVLLRGPLDGLTVKVRKGDDAYIPTPSERREFGCTKPVIYRKRPSGRFVSEDALL